MEQSFAKFSQSLENTLQILSTNLEFSETKTQDASKNAALLAESVKAASKSVLIELGDGLWAQKSRKEAIDFYKRKMKCISIEKDHIGANIKEVRKTLNDLRSLEDLFRAQAEERNISSEILPIVDIQEILDEDGNLIGAKLNDEPFTARSGSMNDNRSPQIDLRNKEVENSQSLQIRELLKDMEIWDSDYGTNTQSVTSSAAKYCHESNFAYICGADEETSSPKVDRNTEKHNLLQLEVIANEICSEENMGEEEEEEEEEEEDNADCSSQDSNDDASEPESDLNEQFSLLPYSSKHHDRLWKEIEDLRAKKKQSILSKVEKRVHFKEEIEVKEVENVGRLLRDVEYEKQSISRFKENLIMNNRSDSKFSSIASSERNKTPAESSSPCLSKEVTRDIIEKPYNAEISAAFSNPNAVEEFNAKATNRNSKNSRFKSSRLIEANGTANESSHQVNSVVSGGYLDDSEHKDSNLLSNDKTRLIETDEFHKLEKEVAKDRKKNVTSKFKKMIHQNPKQSPQGKQSFPLSSSISERDLEEVSEPCINCTQKVLDGPQGSEDCTRGLIFAYNSGSFDDDLDLIGPVVNEMKDLEKINSIIDSMPASVRQSDVHADEDEECDQYKSRFDSVPSDSDEEIFMTEIVENEYDPLSYSPEEDSTIEQDIIQREIESNYYRLREKIYADF